MKITNEQIEKAVIWWADQVTKPTFNALTDEERKQPGNRGMEFAEALASISVKPISQTQRAIFISTLRSTLKVNRLYNRWALILDVDYHPCEMLSNAAKFAGIPESNFPWKTTMWVMENGRVLVRLGYGGKEQEL